MTATITITAAGFEEDLRDIAKWLREDDDLRPTVSLVRQPADPEHMGAVLDAVVLAATSNTANTAVKSLFEWLGRRREAKRVTLTLREGDGRELALTCGGADDARVVLAEVDRFFHSGR